MTSNAITNTVLRFFAAVDDRDWDRARSLMTNPFHLDYSSFGAGPASDLSPDDVLEGWKGLLPGFDVTHHQLGALEVDQARTTADVHTNGTATHFIETAGGAPVWTVVGRYHIRLALAGDSWRLAGLTFAFKYQDGNRNLPSMAALRVKGRGDEASPSNR